MIIKPIFATLKPNYHTSPSDIHLCKMHFPNTCAIRMSEALVKTNKAFLEVFENSGKNTCPHGYIRGAQDLAAVLGSSKGLGARDFGWSAQSNGTAPAGARGAKGIICYMNIPSFSGQGHIDLWDGERPVGNAYWDAQTIWLWKLP